MRLVTIPIAVALAVMAECAAIARSDVRRSPVPVVTIESPVNGTRTYERTAVIAGRAPAAPRGGEVSITVSVNGRPVDIEARRSRFRVAVVLDLGVNRILARADIYGPDEDDLEPETVTSEAVELTRVRGPGTGVLNLATALWVTEASPAVYWLCGEAESCLARPVCVRLSTSRIDCPVESRFQPDRPRTCGVVISVQLRGRRVYFYSYRCRGRWHRNSREFVRAQIRRTGRRYRVDERNADWLAEEINEPNRYGLPRFDVVRDLFIP